MFFPPEIVFPARLVSLLLVRIMGALGAALCYREKIAIFQATFLVLQYISSVAKLQNVPKTSNDGRLGSFLQKAKLTVNNSYQ